MHGLAPELRQLASAGSLDPATASHLIARENGQLFSVHRELLVLLYLAVAAIVAGVGLLVKENLDRIGPVTLIASLVAAAALCYASAIRTARRGEARSTAGDYVLLLGALLLSAAVGYAEYAFRSLGADWSWHLLLLAGVHGITASRHTRWIPVSSCRLR